MANRYSKNNNSSKRIIKTVIPYIFWSIFGILFQIFYLNTISNVDLSYIFNCLISGRAIPAYWFFIPLFELYVLFTVFVHFVNNQKRCLIFLVFLLGLNCVLNYYNITLVGYSFFAVFGFYVHKQGISRKLRVIFYVLAIFGFLVNSFGSYYLSISAGKLIRTYIEYSFLPAMLYPCGLFVFIKYHCLFHNQNQQQQLLLIISFFNIVFNWLIIL